MRDWCVTWELSALLVRYLGIECVLPVVSGEYPIDRLARRKLLVAEACIDGGSDLIDKCLWRRAINNLKTLLCKKQKNDSNKNTVNCFSISMS